MKKKPLVEYLDIDEFSYIENDIVKSKLNESQLSKHFMTWDECWNRVRDVILRIIENENRNDTES